MISSPTLSFATRCALAYAEAHACHGDLNLDAEAFGRRLQQILDQQFNPAVDVDSEAGFRLIEKLHTNDLYLTCACTVPVEAAWGRFLHLYRRQVIDLACYACGSVDLGEEVADLVLTGMYLPDRQGRSRIAAFDGRIPLGAWLRVVVTHQAYKECKRKCNQFASLADTPDLLDPLSAVRLEARLRDHTYREMIILGLRHACKQLSDRERLILLLRYEEGLTGGEVASLLEVAASTVSRALQGAQQKLKAAIVSFLTVEWDGLTTEINECLADLLENPNYSLLALLKEAPSQP